MSLSFLIACIYVHVRVCVWGRERWWWWWWCWLWWGWAGVVTDWLALFIITWVCVCVCVCLRLRILKVKCVFPHVRLLLFRQHVCLCECVIAISVRAVTEMLIVWKCTSDRSYPPLPSSPSPPLPSPRKGSFMEPNDSCLSPTWHRLTLSLQEHTHRSSSHLYTH